MFGFGVHNKHSRLTKLSWGQWVELASVMYSTVQFICWILEFWSLLCVCLFAQLCLTLWDTMDCGLPGSFVHGDSLGKNTGVGCHALLQGTFPTQGLNLGLPHCRWIIYHLSHQGSPWILKWVAYPFSRGSSHPRSQTGISCVAGGFFTSRDTRESLWSLLGHSE